MNRTTFNKAVVPGLFAFMIDGYKNLASQANWKKILNGKSARGSKRAYEEAAYAAGLGLFAYKPEGQSIEYDEFTQGPKIVGLLGSNFEVIKKTVSGKILNIRTIPRKDYYVH